ncbi:unnamed protein product [Urochloa decumbens]|uniref:Cytochrome P450 71A1 n=1 Tax=Urochloa decumbens TaxID=240449 RepID=A0ABC8W3S3_9POAL
MAPVQLDSNLLLLSVVFVVSCFAIVRNVWSRHNRSLPPSPPALPIIGNLHQLGRSHYHRNLQALARRHGPLFLLRLGSVPTLVVSSASVAEEVLRTQDHVFCGRPPQRTARGLLYDCRDVAFSPYGERWRQLRRIAAVRLLSAKRVDSFRALREQEVASFLDRIRSAGADGVNVSELLVGLTYAVISKAAFGNKLGGMEPGAVRAMMRETSDLLEDRERAAGKLDAVLEGALREHEKGAGGGGDDGEAGDLLDDLLLAVKEGSAGLNLDRTDVKGLIIDLFLAGTDTTSNTMEWTMAELVKNPSEMEKVQAEVRQVVGQHGSVVTEEKLSAMTRLQAAMKEALRLHPPAPMLVPREVVHDTKLHGYDIPAKTRVLVNAWAIGRDDKSWGQDADAFRPERFVQSAGIDYSGKDSRFIPFGSGRRGCPGIGFGTRLAELALANMLYHFDWELPDGQDVDSFEVVESSGLSAGLKCPLTLAPKPLRA